MNIFNSFKAFLKRQNAQQNPGRDWRMLLEIFGLLLIVIVLLNAWAFSNVASGNVGAAPSSGPPPVFSQSSLDAITAVFTNRAAEESKYETGVYQYTDPSQ
jgi:hypothetical protein